MEEFTPIKDCDDREVTVRGTGTSSHVIGIHSWSSSWSHENLPEDHPRMQPTKSMFFDLAEAKRVRDALTREIRWQEGKR